MQQLNLSSVVRIAKKEKIITEKRGEVKSGNDLYQSYNDCDNENKNGNTRPDNADVQKLTYSMYYDIN